MKITPWCADDEASSFRHNELRDLEAEMLKIMVCNNFQLSRINGEVLTLTNRAADTRLDIHARGFWEWQGSAQGTGGVLKEFMGGDVPL